MATPAATGLNRINDGTGATLLILLHLQNHDDVFTFHFSCQKKNINKCRKKEEEEAEFNTIYGNGNHGSVI